MKKLIVLLAFLQISFCFAQRPTGGQRNQGGNQQQSNKPKIPKFEASKVAGIFQYKSKKILKKLKIKSNDSIASEVILALTVYNDSIKKIELKNKDLFEGLDIIVNQTMKVAIQNRDRETMGNIRKMIQEKTHPIITEINTLENALNLTLKSILSEDQYKKWLTYQRLKREALKPETNRPESRNKSGNRRPGGRRG